jgi:hypothetical protein
MADAAKARSPFGNQRPSHKKGALILMTEVARQLGVRPETIANSEELKPFWLGGRRYMFTEDFIAWRNRNRRNAP